MRFDFWTSFLYVILYGILLFRNGLKTNILDFQNLQIE